MSINSAMEHKGFPFMSLPPELRNRVYEYALHHNRFEGHCANTSLLRINKQIQHECMNMIFESPSVFTFKVCCAAARPWNMYDEEVYIDLTGDLTLYYKGETRDYDQKFPEQIFNMKEIVLQIDLPRDDRPINKSSRREYVAAKWVVEGFMLALRGRHNKEVERMRVVFSKEIRESVPEKESQFLHFLVGRVEGVEVVVE